jgi:hypothetical protein
LDSTVLLLKAVKPGFVASDELALLDEMDLDAEPETSIALK